MSQYDQSVAASTYGMTSDTSVSSSPDTPLSSVESSKPDSPVQAEASPSDAIELPPLDAPDVPVTAIEDLQVRLKAKDGALHLILPPESETASRVALTWTEMWQQFKQLLMGRERFWQPNTPVHLVADDRLLDMRQIGAIADELSEIQLQLKCVHTSRRQTAVVAATAGYSVEQLTATSRLAGSQKPKIIEEPLYVQMTLRSGTEIRHNGTVIVLGDLNPGSTIIAEGDILVWGRLRGVAHAGCKGNTKCLIMALQLEPTQIRIADFVARAPENPPAQYVPEVAYVSAQRTIRIARAIDFAGRKEEGVEQ